MIKNSYPFGIEAGKNDARHDHFEQKKNDTERKMKKWFEISYHFE